MSCFSVSPVRINIIVAQKYFVTERWPSASASEAHMTCAEFRLCQLSSRHRRPHCIYHRESKLDLFRRTSYFLYLWNQTKLLSFSKEKSLSFICFSLIEHHLNRQKNQTIYNILIIGSTYWTGFSFFVNIDSVCSHNVPGSYIYWYSDPLSSKLWSWNTIPGSPGRVTC